MKHILYIGPKVFQCDSEAGPYTHAVIGQRNPETEKPQLDAANIKQGKLTGQERVALQKFVFDQTHGRYELKPLDWATSAEEAAQKALAFAGWLNVRVVGVDTIIP